MADLITTLLQATFEAVLATIVVLLAFSYVSFLRMNQQLRRARMFIMADRVQRVIMAFLLGFLVLVVQFMSVFVGLVLPPAVSLAVVYFFLAMVMYASVELFLIARPTQRWKLPRRRTAVGEAARGVVDDAK